MRLCPNQELAKRSSSNYFLESTGRLSLLQNAHLPVDLLRTRYNMFGRTDSCYLWYKDSFQPAGKAWSRSLGSIKPVTMYLLRVLTASTTLAAASEKFLPKRQNDSIPNVEASMTVTLGTTYQSIEGFGFSEAFGSASSLQYVSAATQKTMFDMLFSPVNGSGMTIIRNGIGSSANNVSNMLSILRQPPTLLNGTISPNGTANYTWDGNDNGQVWLSKQAMKYGDMTIIADAWSAPPFMKTNDEEIFAGYICGVTGATCQTGDWRQAYANYLVQYIKFYEQEGIPIKHIGFLNEPDLT